MNLEDKTIHATMTETLSPFLKPKLSTLRCACGCELKVISGDLEGLKATAKASRWRLVGSAAICPRCQL